MSKLLTLHDESEEPEESALVSGRPSCRRGSVDVSQCYVEATRHPAAAVTRRLHHDPDQTGQESQGRGQEEVEEGWGEQGGRGPAAGGRTVEEEGVEVLSPSIRSLTGARQSRRLIF